VWSLDDDTDAKAMSRAPAVKSGRGHCARKPKSAECKAARERRGVALRTLMNRTLEVCFVPRTPAWGSV
jgi:hypothetical protein